MIDPKTIMYEEGRHDALDLAARAPQMDGTALISEEEKMKKSFTCATSLWKWAAPWPVRSIGSTAST